MEEPEADPFLFVSTDLPWGLNRGHPTTPLAVKPKPSNRKGKSSARTAHVKAIVREVAGFAPYERRVMELIRNSKVCFITGIGGEEDGEGRELEQMVC